MSTPNIKVQYIAVPSITNLPGPGTGTTAIFTRGKKFFELSYQLGNVLTTVSDAKIIVDPGSDGTVD